MSENPTKGCSKAQIEAFEAIATGSTGAGFYRKTLDILERKGLIEGEDKALAGWPPCKIRVYHVPTPVHMQWCAWCAEQSP